MLNFFRKLLDSLLVSSLTWWPCYKYLSPLTHLSVSGLFVYDDVVQVCCSFVPGLSPSASHVFLLCFPCFFFSVIRSCPVLLESFSGSVFRWSSWIFLSLEWVLFKNLLQLICDSWVLHLGSAFFPCTSKHLHLQLHLDKRSDDAV